MRVNHVGAASERVEANDASTLRAGGRGLPEGQPAPGPQGLRDLRRGHRPDDHRVDGQVTSRLPVLFRPHLTPYWFHATLYLEMVTIDTQLVPLHAVRVNYRPASHGAMEGSGISSRPLRPEAFTLVSRWAHT